MESIILWNALKSEGFELHPHLLQRPGFQDGLLLNPFPSSVDELERWGQATALLRSLLVECWSFSCVWLFATPHQAPLSVEFSRKEYWIGLPFPSPRDLPNPGIEPRSPVLQADSLLSWKEPNAFVFSTLGENKTKMKKCIPHIQFCLSAHLDFTERNSNEFLLFSLGKAKRGCPAHEVIGMPLNQLWSEISAV